MSALIKALLSMAGAVTGVVAIATRTTTLVDIIGGIVVLVAILVFARSIMAFASEPGEEDQRPSRPH
jgi:L-lactate permease